MSEPSLDEVLSDDYQVEEVTGEAEVETVEDTAEAVEETYSEEATEVPPTSEPQEKRIDPEQFKGYLDEREKRQKLEAELQQLKQQQTQKQEPEIDPIDDPKGFQEQMDAKLRQATFEIERKFMSKLHPDWTEAETWINEQIGTNAAIQARLSNSESLLEDAYKMYQDHKALQEVGEVGTLKQQLDEAKAKLAAFESGEVQAKEAEQEAVKVAATRKPSLADAGNSTGSIGGEGLMSLEDMLGSDFNHRPK